ncbi:MAG: tRNA adenosine(34) deaminase TadA [Gemmatimonadota bacterium]
MTAPGLADENMMRVALDLAREASLAGDVPVGAIITRNGVIIGRASNRTERDGDPTAHAEMLALRDAAAIGGTARLADCTMYVTLEPCAMCAGAIIQARLARVVFGAWDDKAGMAGSVEDLLRHPRLNHAPEVSAACLGDECGELLRTFFGGLRRS